MTTYVDCNDLCKQFGLPFEEMDKILIEHGLKSGELATQKAIDDGYATRLATSAPWNHWNIFKISQLIGKNFTDEVRFSADNVLNSMQYAHTYYLSVGMDRMAMLAVSQSFKDVPKDLWDEVTEHVEKVLMGDKREVCEKCGRTSPTQMMTRNESKYLCWRCKPDDAFIEARLRLEGIVKAAAPAGLNTIYIDRHLMPQNGDIRLWAGVYSDAVDFSIGGLINPTLPIGDTERFIENRTDPQAVLEFKYSGFEEFDFDHCYVFLTHAYETIAKTLEAK